MTVAVFETVLICSTLMCNSCVCVLLFRKARYSSEVRERQRKIEEAKITAELLEKKVSFTGTRL